MPGFHIFTHFVDRIEQVPIGMQTTRVSNVPCGTSGGVIVEFEQVEVVWRLNRVHVETMVSVIARRRLTSLLFALTIPVSDSRSLVSMNCLLVAQVRNYSTAFAEMWVAAPVPAEVDQVCSRLSLHEVFISRFSELDDELRKALAALHARHAPGLEVGPPYRVAICPSTGLNPSNVYTARK